MRVEIIDAADRLLDQHGDESAVTLRAVAREVGISAPSIYLHFADRQQLMLAVATRAFAELADHLGRVRDSAPDDGGPGARLRAVCEGYLAYARRHPQRYRLMFGGVWDGRRAVEQGVLDEQDLRELGADVLAVLGGVLDECTAAGVRAPTGADSDSEALQQPQDGLVVWVGLHGLAHQRMVSTALPWTPQVDQQLVDRLTGLIAS